MFSCVILVMCYGIVFFVVVFLCLVFCVCCFVCCLVFVVSVIVSLSRMCLVIVCGVCSLSCSVVGGCVSDIYNVCPLYCCGLLVAVVFCRML